MIATSSVPTSWMNDASSPLGNPLRLVDTLPSVKLLVTLTLRTQPPCCDKRESCVASVLSVVGLPDVSS